MSTTKQMSLMEMINRLSAGIEDDELFCQEEFEMVRNYCEQKSFMMSAADLSTIRRIGLMDRFESWKEEHRLYGLTFDQARKRKDYSFTLNELPSLIDDLQKDYMSATCENGDPYRGVAVLEVGYVDVELNITTYEQCGRSVTENDKRPILGYFVCIKQGEQEDDWVSDDYIDYEIQINWHDSNWQKNLERDMFFALNDYVVNHHLSYDEPNIRPYVQSVQTASGAQPKKDSYESMVLDYLALFDSDDHIVNRNGNNFLIANYRTFTSYKLEVIDGRLKVLQETKVLQDCIENAKSAYDVDPEFMGKIREFEKKWYVSESHKVKMIWNLQEIWLNIYSRLNSHFIEKETKKMTKKQREMNIKLAVDFMEEIKMLVSSVTEDVSDSESMTEAWNKIDRFYKDIESMRNKQKCTGSKSFSILQSEVDGHTKYLQGIDLPIMINSILENENFMTSEVSEMHIGMVNGNQVLIITPEIISLSD